MGRRIGHRLWRPIGPTTTTTEEPDVCRSQLEELDREMGLYVTASLSSFQTTWLRCCSRTSRDLFVRNCPATTDLRCLYVEGPDCPWYLRHQTTYDEVHRKNLHSPLRVWKTPNVVRQIMTPRVQQLAPHIKVIQYGSLYDLVQRGKGLGKVLLQDRALVMALVEEDPKVFALADASLKQDRDFVKRALDKGGSDVLRHLVDDDLRRDRALFQSAVGRHPDALEWAHDDLKRDHDLVLRAVRSSSRVLEYADVTLRRDPNFVLKAIDLSNGYALKYADPTVKQNRGVALAAVAKTRDALRYVDPALAADPEILHEAKKFQPLNILKALEHLWNVSGTLLFAANFPSIVGIHHLACGLLYFGILLVTVRRPKAVLKQKIPFFSCVAAMVLLDTFASTTAVFPSAVILSWETIHVLRQTLLLVYYFFNPLQIHVMSFLSLSLFFLFVTLF